MKTIALIDTAWVGHRPSYFKIMAKSLLTLDYCVLALCPEPDEVREWLQEQNPALARNLRILPINAPDRSRLPIGPLQAKLTAIAYWQNAAQAMGQAVSDSGLSPDIVFFTWLDDYLKSFLTHHLIDKIFPYCWSGLYFHPAHIRLNYRYKTLGQVTFNPHAILKSPNCASVAVLDEGVAQPLQQDIQKPVIIFPDFTDTSPPDFDYPLIKAIQDRAKGRKIIGLLGDQSKRKGLLTLLRAAMKSANTDCFFLFCGPEPGNPLFSSEERAYIDQVRKAKPDNCYFHFDRIPTEARFNAIVFLCTVLFAAYEGFLHSSNLLTKAAYFDKPLIVSEQFCMGERIRKYQLGLTIEPGNVDQLPEAIDRLLYLKNNDCQIKPDFAGYRQEHSIDRLLPALQTIVG